MGVNGCSIGILESFTSIYKLSPPYVLCASVHVSACVCALMRVCMHVCVFLSLSVRAVKILRDEISNILLCFECESPQVSYADSLVFNGLVLEAEPSGR